MTSPSAPDAPETIFVYDHRVSCDGGGGALGHPKVFLEMGADGKVVCGYCGRVYIMRRGPADPSKSAA